MKWSKDGERAVFLDYGISGMAARVVDIRHSDLDCFEFKKELLDAKL